jgi:hypothetical protein
MDDMTSPTLESSRITPPRSDGKTGSDFLTNCRGHGGQEGKRKWVRIWGGGKMARRKADQVVVVVVVVDEVGASFWLATLRCGATQTTLRVITWHE